MQGVFFIGLHDGYSQGVYQYDAGPGTGDGRSAPGFGGNRTDDIDHYLWACLKNRKCAVCGRTGEIHHVDAIGMGNDRTEVDDSDSRKICLCRIHHTEAHAVGMAEFEERYRVYGIKFVA